MSPPEEVVGPIWAMTRNPDGSVVLQLGQQKGTSVCRTVITFAPGDPAGKEAWAWVYGQSLGLKGSALTEPREDACNCGLTRFRAALAKAGAVPSATCVDCGERPATCLCGPRR